MIDQQNWRRRIVIATVALALCAAALAGCSRPASSHGDFRIGDQVVVGNLTYTVVEMVWRNQLEAIAAARSPQRSFLLLRMTVTNGGGKEVSLPLQELQNSAGDHYAESQDGSGVDGWLGLLRRIGPAQTIDGWMLFDVPRNSYDLILTDGNLESEKRAVVSIPLRISD